MFLWRHAAGPRRVVHISRGRRMGIHRTSAGLEAPLGVHAHRGVGLRRVPARRFICGTSASHNKHGGGAERLNKDKANAARRSINAVVADSGSMAR